MVNLKLVVGLGNPGNKYDGTRHNVGFEVIDKILERHDLRMTDQKFRADYFVWHHSARKDILLKPFTYMNLSGEAVLPMMSYYGISADDVLVIHDDLDLDVGKIRFRPKGSSNGQRGMQNIIDLLGSQEIKRLKIGIGRPSPGWKVVDHVLAPIKGDDRIIMDQAIDQAAEAVELWLDGEAFENVMSKYN